MFIPDIKNAKCVFIDECGNFGTDFSKRGNSSHFIITGIVIDKSSVLEVRKNIDNIRKKIF